MAWLHQHGLISCYDDYAGLPFGVIEDCLLLMKHEVDRARLQNGGAP